jgi:HlyD family type I secretion membrane fusion protein
VNSPLSKLPPRFQAPVRAALQALTAPADLSDAAVTAAHEPQPGERDLLKDRMRKPIVIGGVIMLVFVLIAGIWASFAKIEGAVSAPGLVRSEFNRRTIRQRDGGTIATLNVHEGDRVKQGQVLMTFTPTQPQASVDVMRNQSDSERVQSARFEAEMLGKPAIVFPADLTERAKTDTALAGLMRDQTFVFQTRRRFVDDQRAVFRSQIEQLRARMEGLKLQVQANETSAGLIREQLKGFEALYEKGFAPRNQVLNMQRTLSDLGGQRGANIANISAVQEQMGEVRSNLAKLDQQFQTEAAEGLRASQVRLADALPRLRSAEELLENSTVRSPVDGIVIGLTQHTVGAATGAGERLMDIVPVNEPTVIEAKVKPTDIEQVKVGQKARVMLTAYNSRTHQGVDGVVTNVSPDLIETPDGQAFFRVVVRIGPEALAASHNKDVVMTVGMPATVMLVTGDRSIMNYLLSPFTAPLMKALKEE